MQKYATYYFTSSFDRVCKSLNGFISAFIFNHLLENVCVFFNFIGKLT